MAALAVLLGALVPLLAQAGYRLSGDRAWLQVCSANGVREIAVDPLFSPSGDEEAAPSGKCAWCKLHATVGMPSSGRHLSFISPRSSASAGPAEIDVPPLLPVWTPAYPRAPPVRS